MKFGSSKNINSWELFADEILRFGIIKQGPVGDDLAKQGLLLPGFKSQDDIEKETQKNLASAWKLLEGEISSKSLFASAVRLVRSDKHDAALVAFLAAVEVRPERRRVVAGLGGKADGAVTLARSAHTDHAMLEYADAPVMSVQGHPEFGDAFVAALYAARRGRLSDEQVDGAIASLAERHDNEMMARWMVKFLRGAQGW